VTLHKSFGKWLAAAAVVAVLATAAPSARAADALDELDVGPAVGVSLPYPLTLADQTGAQRDFASLKSERGLIVMFSRSFEW